jgi:hypothetical protein
VHRIAVWSQHTLLRTTINKIMLCVWCTIMITYIHVQILITLQTVCVATIQVLRMICNKTCYKITFHLKLNFCMHFASGRERTIRFNNELVMLSTKGSKKNFIIYECLKTHSAGQDRFSLQNISCISFCAKCFYFHHEFRYSCISE